MGIKSGSIFFLGSLLLLFAATGGGYAQEEVSPATREDVGSIEKIVAQLTDFAVQTHLNADYMPGMVTVFYGRDLENRGIRSAGEALNLVPGMNLSHTSQIYWKTVARGVPRPFAAGHVKLLLNGIPLTTTFGIDLVPNLPIEQVDRIEIVRGPGSTLHGEQAVTGVVNIVTLETGDRVYGSIGRYRTFRGGGMTSLMFPDHQLSMSLNVAGTQSKGADVEVGAAELAYLDGVARAGDAGTSGFEEIDGAFDEGYRASRAGILSLDWRETSFRAQWLESRRDEWYQTEQLVGAVRQHFAPSPSLEVDAELSFLKREFDSDLENGIEYVLPDNSEGWIYEFDYNEQRLEAGVDLAWQIDADNRFLFDYAFSHSDLSDVVRQLDPDTIYEGDDRQVNSIRFQEQWQAHDRILLTGGVGYDHYSDIGGQVSPKIASVFRLNARRGSIRRHILKIQYGRAFRPPTFLETRTVLNASGPEPETIDTFEVGYITRKFDGAFRITAYRSKLTACVEMPGEREVYDINGVEVEYSKSLVPDLIGLDANLSYTATKNRDSGNEISGSADWLSNIGLTYTPFHWLSLSLQLHSVFNRNEEASVDADGPEDTHLLDATARLQFPGNQDWTLHLGVKNAFKEDIRLYTAQREGGEAYDFVAPGFERPGRFLWMSLSYDF
jgi:iron complex outermembrane receptor protein